MKNFTALFFTIIFLSVGCASYERGEGINLESGQKPGAKPVIQKKENQFIEGELIAVKENSLLLKEQGSGMDVSIGVSDIRVITIVRRAKSGTGALVGGLVGAGIGIVVLQASDSELANDPGILDELRKQARIPDFQ